MIPLHIPWKGEGSMMKIRNKITGPESKQK